jgi:HEPN domain
MICDRSSLVTSTVLVAWESAFFKMVKPRRSSPRPASSRSDFRRVAFQRLEDARTLLRAERTTGAFYLAGYAVECILKAMALSRAPTRKRDELAASFRGKAGHSLENLKGIWAALGGEPFSRDMARAFATVTAWSTDYRYVPGTIDYETAEEFVDACSNVIQWADGRIAHGQERESR